MTHYIPAFTIFRGREARTQQAACGRFVSKTEHSNEPTCPKCQQYLTADAVAEEAIGEGLGLERRNGIWVEKGRE